ncbi:MAG: hypothetical protein QOE61_339 [Micromonosporaceae bacterium]|jgi:hypothetical protein|nr:hypothetical protein [Micromonosporaceae bacterium]
MGPRRTGQIGCRVTRNLLELADSADLTQYGEEITIGEATFRNRLRVAMDETEISLILGRVDRVAASVLVTKVIMPAAVVRYTTVGILRSQGFIVVHSPTKTNRLHVSVHPPTAGGEPAEWDDKLASTFDECFTVEGGADGVPEPRA